jgi:hypothetical protein
MPLSESLGQWRCGCFDGLERAVVLASSMAPVPGTAGPVAANKQVTTPIFGPRTPEPAGGSASSGLGDDWADALLRWRRSPWTWARRLTAQQTAAWAENSQCHIRQCLQWPGGGPDFPDIHTGIFQGKIKKIPGLETPPVRSSDPTVQYSVGPMIRFYTRHVPILQTFFIREFRGP